MLPPLPSEHVRRYMTMLANVITTINYINHLRSACRVLQAVQSRHNESVVIAEECGRLEEQCLPGPADKTSVLLFQAVERLVHLCDGNGDCSHKSQYITWWDRHLRGPSEGLPLGYGEVSEATRLPGGRHCALFVEDDGLNFRLVKRRNRQAGSWRKHPCHGSVWGKHMCALHCWLAAPNRGGVRITQRIACEAVRVW